MIECLAEMIKFPVSTLLTGCEVFTGAVRVCERAFSYGVDTLLGGLTQLSAPAAQPAACSSPGEIVVDQDLGGDDLKLVKYRILQTRRDREYVIDFGEDIVNYSTTAADYVARVVSEYVNRHPEVVEQPGDEKYIRSFVWVVARYPKRQKEYDREQVEVLREIRDEIRETARRI